MADYERYPRQGRDWRDAGLYDRDRSQGGRSERRSDDDFRGYAEDRSFERSGTYRSEFGDRDRDRSQRDAAGRYGEYRRSDYRGVRPYSADMRDSYADYTGYESYPFAPFDPVWGFAPGVGYGRDYRRDRDERSERRSDGRHHRNFWDRASDELASWFGDDRAQTRRDRDRGEHSGRGPKGYKRSDSRILEDVSDRLTHDSWIDASDIEVRVDNGEVTLDGKVDSRQAKRSAERIAEEVMGVSHVQNNLRVGASEAADITGGSPTLRASGEAILRSRSGQA